MDNDDKSKMSDTIKKLLATGVSAAFMTEESIRRLVADVSAERDAQLAFCRGRRVRKKS